MLQVLVNVSLEKFQLQKKKKHGLCKSYEKREEKRKVLKNGQVIEISKTMGTQMPA